MVNFHGNLTIEKENGTLNGLIQVGLVQPLFTAEPSPCRMVSTLLTGNGSEMVRNTAQLV